jgi:hypothetical protein
VSRLELNNMENTELALSQKFTFNRLRVKR